MRQLNIFPADPVVGAMSLTDWHVVCGKMGYVEIGNKNEHSY